MMKYTHIICAALLVLVSTLTQAQVKIGRNPTTITPGALLDIEGSTTTTRTVSLTNGNFGIGTTSPVAKLDVGGNIGFYNTPANGQIAGYSNTLILSGGTGGLLLNNNNNSANNVYVSNSGNVGIRVGTGEPLTKLNVGGTIGFYNSLTHGQIGGIDNALKLLVGTQGLHINNNNGSANNVYVSNSGNVGIGVGTGEPLTKLNVGGNIGFYNTPANGQIGGYANTLILSGGTGGLLLNNNNNSANNVYVSNSGNVGIGTTAPTAKLHVNGNQVLGVAATAGSTDNVAQVVRDNATGELKVISSSTGNNKAFNYAHYSLQNVQSDYVFNFDTQIPTSEYTVIITGASFTNKVVLKNTVGDLGYYNPLNFRAYDLNGTWRLNLDYVGGQTTDGTNGTWEIDVLIISNGVVKNVGTQAFNLGGNNSGSAGSRPSGL